MKTYIGLQSLLDFFNSFHTLTPGAYQAIVDICSTHHFIKNKILQPIGHTCRTIYFIQSGAARIYYFKDKIEITESFVFEHNILARVESLFSGRPSKKAIELIEPSEIIGIDSIKLFRLYDSYPGIERLFRKIFESAFVESVRRTESIQFHTAEERYRSLLTEKPDILKRVPLKHIASYLGITQVSLSRIRSAR